MKFFDRFKSRVGISGYPPIPPGPMPPPPPRPVPCDCDMELWDGKHYCVGGAPASDE